MENPQEVSLLVEGQIFRAKKDVLCEHSDYFKAMFSGNYVEQEKAEIEINIVDANSMDILLRYMDMGFIDLSEYSLNTISDLASAANFLQITELIKQIPYCLEIQLSTSNWIETMIIAENSSYTSLEQSCAVFGLLNFNAVNPEIIPNINKLFWYLSHPYLDVSNELDVFRMGLQWIKHAEMGPDALLVILGCLDIKRVTCKELKKISCLIKDQVNSLAAKVVDCFSYLSCNHYEISRSNIIDQRSVICEKFTERVYNEVLNMVQASHKRIWNYTTIIPMWKMTNDQLESSSNYLYLFDENIGFEKWVEIAEMHLWGYNIVTWKGNKLLLVCGEHGRGTGLFMRDVKVFDTFKKEWTWHGVQLPSRRHGSVAINGDLLYFVGGVGGFRIILDSVVVYNLNERTHRHIAKLPEALQSPAVCVHENKLYASGQRNMYRYSGDHDRWVLVLSTEIRVNHMVSFKNYIYCAQNYFNQLYRFRPGTDKVLELITCLNSPPEAICNHGDRLLFYTRETGGTYQYAVEEYTGKPATASPKVIWTDKDAAIKIYEAAGSCKIMINEPPANFEISPYHKQHLMRYAE